MKTIAFTLLMTGTMLGLAVGQNPPPIADDLQRSAQNLADQIQRQVQNQMRNAAGAALGTAGVPFGSGAPLPQERFEQMHWNHFRQQLMPVPDVLRSADPALHDGEGLIVGLPLVQPDGTERLSRGDILLGQDGRPLRTSADFQAPSGPTTMRVLRADGEIISLELDPALIMPAHPAWAHGMPAAVPNRMPPKHGFGFSGPSGSSSAATTRRSSEALSVSNVNGDIQVRGHLQVAGESVPIDLRGTAAEIDAQIENLPAEVRAKLRNQVRY